MLKNYFLITLRSLLKNKLFISINIIGMAISIACCIVAYYNYDFNDRFDSYHVNASKVYRVNSIRTFQNRETKFGYVPIALGNVAMQIKGDIAQVIRFSPGNGDFRIKEEVFFGNLTYVDPAFFDVFTFEFIEGNADEFDDKGNIYISDELAIKYFGSESALGKPITQLFDSGKVKDFVVAGIFKKPPTNSSFNYANAYTNFYNQFKTDPAEDYTENSWRYRSTLFITINDPSRVEVVAKGLLPYVENNNKIREDFIIKEYEIEPFVGMAVRDSYNEVNGTWTNSGSPIAAIVGVGMMGILVLLIACFNLTNTAIAISSGRLKEIGIRKVMGSTRNDLIAQFLGETIGICLVSLLIGMLLADLLLIPAFNELWPEMKLTTNYFGNPQFLIFMIVTLLFTGLLAGGYPAFYISHFQPTYILKGKLKFGGTNLFTRVLLTLQFAISLIAIVCSFAFVDNAKYQRDLDLGFNREDVVFTYVNSPAEYETFRNRLAQNPDVISISGSQHHFNSNVFSDPIKHADKEIETDIMDVGENYVKTVGLELLEGRDFVKDSETDKNESVIITKNLAQRFGWDQPIGKEIIWSDTVKYYVIGVVQDVYNRGVWREMEPVMFRYQDSHMMHIIASAPIDKMQSLKADMESIYKSLFPERVANVRFMNDSMVGANTVNNNIVKMFVFLGIVALALSATGLFTLVSLNIIKKMKEIGVRKALGATLSNITKVINKEFVIILTIASVLGLVAGSWLSGMLMDSIWDYYQNATIATMIISALVLFITSVLSIGYKVFKTVRLNPAYVLRDE
ncbi:MAG TPA: ABC transporter permease [Cyclobacteriaceae bacterium]